MFFSPSALHSEPLGLLLLLDVKDKWEHSSQLTTILNLQAIGDSEVPTAYGSTVSVNTQEWVGMVKHNSLYPLDECAMGMDINSN